MKGVNIDRTYVFVRNSLDNLSMKYDLPRA